jgi:hypothetical protein
MTYKSYGFICMVVFIMYGCKSSVAKFDYKDELWYQRAQNGSVIEGAGGHCAHPSSPYIVAGIGSSYGGSIGIRNVAVLAPEVMDGDLRFQGASLETVRKPALQIDLIDSILYFETQAEIQQHSGQWPTDFSSFIKPSVKYRHMDFFADESWINGRFCVIVAYGREEGPPDYVWYSILLDMMNMVTNTDYSR